METINYQKRFYKRLNLRRGNTIVLSNKDLIIIDAIGEVLKTSPRKDGKFPLTKLEEEVRKKIGKGKGWGIDNQIKYCLMVLFIKRKIGINNHINARQKQWRTWVWLFKRRKRGDYPF